MEVRWRYRDWLVHLLSNEAKSSGLTSMHHPPKAKRVIQLFMTGGASPMDTFDYKPALEKVHGKKLGPKENQKVSRQCLEH